MSATPEFTSLKALPPSVGDAAVAAVLLRDVVASFDGHHGSVRADAVEVGDSGRFTLRRLRDTGSLVDAEHAPVAAPELFDGAGPDALTDVYAAAFLALTRYLGTSPVSAPALAHRAPTRVQLGALRQAHRTLPARLGAMPAPFRGAFAQAVGKERHLRPSPARLVALLDTALAEAGPGVEQAARARVHRLVVLARAFEPGGSTSVLKAPPSITAFAPHPMPELVPLRALPVFSLRTRAARGVLVAAVTVIVTGGVAVAAVVGLGGSAPRPLAVSTLPVPSTASGPSVGPSDSSAPAPSGAAPTSTVGGRSTGAVVGGGGGVQGGSGGDGSLTRTEYSAHHGAGGSGGSGSGGSGGGGSTGGGHPGGGSTPPPASSHPGSTPPGSSSSPPSSSPPSTDPPSTDPPSTDPPSTDPPSTDPPSTNPPSTDPPSPTDPGPTSTDVPTGTPTPSPPGG